MVKNKTHYDIILHNPFQVKRKVKSLKKVRQIIRSQSDRVYLVDRNTRYPVKYDITERIYRNNPEFPLNNIKGL